MTDKPPARKVNHSGIPSEMKELPRFVLWRFSYTDKGKWSKVPYQANNPHKTASSTDPGTWTSFEAALCMYHEGHGDGISFALGDGIGAFDLDHSVFPDGSLVPLAEKIIARVDSYAEFTPLDGARIIGTYTKELPQQRKSGDLELYTGQKFITVTGHHIPGTPTELRDITEHLHHFYKLCEPRQYRRRKGDGSGGADASIGDDLIITKIVQHPKYAELWNGNHGRYESQSSADLALTGRIAFFVGPDADRISRIFELSGLMRGKWRESRGRKSYGQITVAKALSSITQFYRWENRSSSNV